MVGRPPVVLERIQSPWGQGPTAEVNKYSLRPFGDFLRATQARPTLTDDPEPRMFNSGTGDLPVYIGCGADVDLLRWCHWSIRHAAAQTPSTATLHAMLEESADDPARFQTADGRRALSDYSARVWRWAVAQPVTDAAAMTAAEYAEFWQERLP